MHYVRKSSLQHLLAAHRASNQPQAVDPAPYTPLPPQGRRGLPSPVSLPLLHHSRALLRHIQLHAVAVIRCRIVSLRQPRQPPASRAFTRPVAWMAVLRPPHSWVPLQRRCSTPRPTFSDSATSTRPPLTHHPPCVRRLSRRMTWACPSHRKVRRSHEQPSLLYAKGGQHHPMIGGSGGHPQHTWA
jgi:hypothetical protein